MRNEPKDLPADAQAERQDAERARWLQLLPIALCGVGVIVFLLSFLF